MRSWRLSSVEVPKSSRVKPLNCRASPMKRRTANGTPCLCEASSDAWRITHTDGNRSNCADLAGRLQFCRPAGQLGLRLVKRGELVGRFCRVTARTRVGDRVRAASGTCSRWDVYIVVHLRIG